MTGPELWTTFLSARVPDDQLAALGSDIGRLETMPSQAGFTALQGLKNAIKARGLDIPISTIFSVLRANMPGILSRKELLEGIAHNYSNGHAWAQSFNSTREYFTAVGSALPAFPPAVRPPAAPLSPPAAHAPTRPVAKTAPARPAIATKPPEGFSAREWGVFKAVISRLTSSKQRTSISDNDLAAARNLAARANLTSTVAQIETEISRRENAERKTLALPAKTPIWPIALGTAIVIGILSLISKKSHRQIHARLGHA